MWTLSLALAAGPLDTSPVDIGLSSTVHPGRAGQHELLVGSSLTLRAARPLAFRLDGDLGLLGPRNSGTLRFTDMPVAFESESSPGIDDGMDVELVAAPGTFAPRTSRVTALVAGQALLTPIRASIRTHDLAFDLGLGAGLVHTADERRPKRETWSRIDPDPLRAQWHPVPVASLGGRLGLTQHVSAQVQARGMTWTESFQDGFRDRRWPVWVTAGLSGAWF